MEVNMRQMQKNATDKESHDDRFAHVDNEFSKFI